MIPILLFLCSKQAAAETLYESAYQVSNPRSIDNSKLPKGERRTRFEGKGIHTTPLVHTMVHGKEISPRPQPATFRFYMSTVFLCNG